MLPRRPVFPNVIEVNYQLQQVLGCNVYIIFDENEWALLDIGYSDTVGEIVELIRQLDFPFSQCKVILASHPDVDHAQGLTQVKGILKTKVACHPSAQKVLEEGDRLATFAEIAAQNIDLEMPPVPIDQTLEDGEILTIGNLELEVWHTPGHTDSQLAFRMGDLLFSGDNIFRDGCVGAIDAHHGSDIPSFIRSLHRIRESDVKWLLPSHGPIFRKENDLLDKTIARLEGYSHMADFGTCATDWPLEDEWEKEITSGKLPSQ
ncbi:MAG: MBL fold metallo-hydrolase [Pirellulaceae bacterium]|nr:MBL fold metallo-hydrolase [Pirellulaceae bacterium]